MAAFFLDRLVNFIIGVLLIIAGFIPILQDQGITQDFLPTNLLIYQIATIILGALLIFFVFRKRRYKLKVN